MKIQDQNDEVYVADTADEIVQMMADQKYRPVKSLGSFRKSTARRINELFDAEIDATNSETFLRTMIAGRFLEELDN